MATMRTRRHSPADDRPAPVPLWDVTAGTATDLLAGLRARGVVLWLEGGRLRWRAPRGAMTVPLLTRVKSLEWDLIALLAAEPVSGENTGVLA